MTYLKSQLQTKHHKQSLGFHKTLTGSSTKFNLKFLSWFSGKDHSIMIKGGTLGSPLANDLNLQNLPVIPNGIWVNMNCLG